MLESLEQQSHVPSLKRSSPEQPLKRSLQQPQPWSSKGKDGKDEETKAVGMTTIAFDKEPSKILMLCKPQGIVVRCKNEPNSFKVTFEDRFAREFISLIVDNGYRQLNNVYRCYDHSDKGKIETKPAPAVKKPTPKPLPQHHQPQQSNAKPETVHFQFGQTTTADFLNKRALLLRLIANENKSVSQPGSPVKSFEPGRFEDHVAFCQALLEVCG